MAQRRPAAARSSSGGLVDTLTMGKVGSDEEEKEELEKKAMGAVLDVGVAREGEARR